MATTIEELEARLAELEVRAGVGVQPLANPPITIGELADVPSPGSPIASQWAQEVSARIVHRFATVAARDAAFPAPAASTLAYVTGTKTLYLWDGGWVIMAEPDITTYVPNWNGVNLGGAGAQRAARYHRSDGYIDFQYDMTIGAAGAVTGPISIDGPVALSTVQRGAFQVYALQSGVSEVVFTSEAISTATATIGILTYSVSGAIVTFGGTSASTPWVWKAGDRIRLSGRAKMLSRFS